jgi:integrase
MAGLTALAVSKAKEKGLYLDGKGLYLQVSVFGTKSWIYRYRMNGRKTPRDMGLGALADVSLAEAREKAQDARKLINAGIDPIEAKRDSRANLALEQASAISFKDAALAYIAAHSKTWRNAKHREQWPSTLETYVYPTFGNLPVGTVDVNHIVKVLTPIWTKKPETASRVRGRIESVLDWAKARGYRSGENPARWRGHLENLMPKRAKFQKVRHHPALPYAEVGTFMAELRNENGTAPLAFQLLILTAARTTEVVGARWDEFDLRKGIWRVPAERIKTGKEHRVPLSKPAVAILKTMRKTSDEGLVFPGGKRGKSLSNNALLAVLKRMGRKTITAHGFRSTFRDWCAEQTNYSRDVAEAALSHAIGNKVEAAYRRGDLLEKRTQLMEQWAKFCGLAPKAGRGSNVVAMRGKTVRGHH